MFMIISNSSNDSHAGIAHHEPRRDVMSRRDLWADGWPLAAVLSGVYFLHCTSLYSTMIYYTILYYTVLCYTILHYTILYDTILYYTIIYYTILYYTILYYTNYTILYHSTSTEPVGRPRRSPRRSRLSGRRITLSLLQAPIYIYIYIYICIYIYIYRERERDMHIFISLSLSTCIYIYIYTHHWYPLLRSADFTPTPSRGAACDDNQFACIGANYYSPEVTESYISLENATENPQDISHTIHWTSDNPLDKCH